MIKFSKFLKIIVFISVIFATQTFSQQTNPPTNPCDNPEAKAFDFQMGVWQAKDGKGTHEIKKILGGCGFQEIWKNDNGVEAAFALKSFDDGRHNATGDKKWFYSWTAAGFHQLWEGRKEDGQWRFYREWVNQGQPMLSRTYWNQLADGSIDRIVEQSRDGGKTWTLWVKANFVRKNN